MRGTWLIEFGEASMAVVRVMATLVRGMIVVEVI